MPPRERRASAHPWWRVWRHDPRAALRLFCVPYAGGSASIYRPWARRLPSGVEIYAIELPGRVNRIGHRPFTRLAPLVEDLANALEPVLDMPFALFGHSLGALISFELARHLSRTGRPTPVHLFLSGRRAPQCRATRPPAHQQGDEEFLATLKELNGTPPEILSNTEILELMLPTLRADFELSETYRFIEDSPLTCPITVFGGREDEESAGSLLDGWSAHTTGAFTKYLLDGGHFYINWGEATLCGALGRELSRSTETGARLR